MPESIDDQILKLIGGASPASGEPSFKELIKSLKGLGDTELRGLKQLRSLVTLKLGYPHLLKLHKCLDAAGALNSDQSVRIALLTGATGDQLKLLLELFLWSRGINCQIWLAPFDTFRQEILVEDSELYRFRPDLVFLAVSRRDIVTRLPANADEAVLERGVSDEFEIWSGYWRLLQNRLACPVVQNTFERSPFRSFSNVELRHPGSEGRFVSELNLRLARGAPESVILHDLDHLAGVGGYANWQDPRFYYHAKLPCSPSMLPVYAHSAVAVIAAHFGGARKCLVLDLDNTLWGGVIGDDGLGGIRLGQGDDEGEAFTEFQQYVRSLRDRGIILAVCSKNEESVARQGFGHPEMVLKLDDISCFVANWDDKASNLRRIARELNIGVQSMAFVDDNPAERDIVRRSLPEVAVPELPPDPAGYIAALDGENLFPVVTLTKEDFTRAELYRGNVLRQAEEETAVDLEGFLRSLEMEAEIAPIDEVSLPRVAQLIQRSNQFNVTTRRRSAAELHQLCQDPSWVHRTVRLKDRFGDNGLISVLLARKDAEEILIDTWLMSCRVLKRGVEQALFNHLYDLAKSAGVRRIVAEFIPSEKNGLVKDLFPGFGMKRAAERDAATGTFWQMDVGLDRAPLNHQIAQVTTKHE